MMGDTAKVKIDDLVLRIDDSDPWMPRVYLFDESTNERLLYIETGKTLHKGDTFTLHGKIVFE